MQRNKSIKVKTYKNIKIKRCENLKELKYKDINI